MKRILLMIVGLLSSLSLAAADSVQPWSGYLRPGFVSRPGSSVGYMDYFLPVWQNENDICFINPKVSFSDDDANEQNLGFGYRHLINNDVILGGNFYYDSRTSTNANHFQQVGVGLEALSKWIDFRLNYYHPTTGAVRDTSLDTTQFGQHGLVQLIGYEEPLPGMDAEIGVLVPYLSDFLPTRIYGGVYSYNAKKSDQDPRGGRFRAEVSPNDLLTFEVKVDFDVYSGTNTTWGAFATLPFEIGNIFKLKNPFEGWRDMLAFGKGPKSVHQRMTDRVVRDIDIVSKSDGEEQTIMNLLYVDNRNDSDEKQDGSLNHPYNTLDKAFNDPHHTTDQYSLYVNRGDGTAVGYTGNYTLANNTTLWGSATNGGYSGLPTTTTPPVISGGGATATDSGVILLGQNNTVQGIQVESEDNGVRATGSVGTVIVRNNIFQNITGSAVQVLQSSGTGNVSITDNRFTNITDGAGNASAIFVVIDQSGNLTSTISRNTISSTDTGIFAGGMPISYGFAPTGTGNFTISNNTMSSLLASGATNSFLTGNTANITFSVLNNNVTTTASSALYVQAFDNSTANASFLYNSVSNCAGACIGIVQNDSSTISSPIVRGNIVQTTAGSGNPGIYVSLAGSGNISSAKISGNTSSRNGGSGISFENTGTGTITTEVEGNTSSNNRENNSVGINFRNTSTGTISATISKNNLVGNFYGVGFSGGGSPMTIDMTSTGYNRIVSSLNTDIINSMAATYNVGKNYYNGGNGTVGGGGGGVSFVLPTGILTTDPGPQ